MLIPVSLSESIKGNCAHGYCMVLERFHQNVSVTANRSTRFRSQRKLLKTHLVWTGPKSHVLRSTFEFII